MLFGKCENTKQKKRGMGGALVLWGLASVGAYAIVSTAKKKMCSLAQGMKNMFSDKKKQKGECGCECECTPDESAFL